jgi:hypothetical protein
LLGPLQSTSKKEPGPIAGALPFFISPFSPHPKRVDVHKISDLLSYSHDDLMKIKKFGVMFPMDMGR